MATTTAAPVASPLFVAHWIVSARYDVGFFIASAVLTFIFWGLYTALAAFGFAPSGLAALLTYFVFTAFFDLPHIFQTFARTHADATERARRPHLYSWGIVLLMASGLLIPLFELDPYFIAALAAYGSYHIIRQHVGFLRIYQRLNEPDRPHDAVLDRLALELSLWACVIHDYTAEKGQLLRDVHVYGPWHATFPALPPFISTYLTMAAWVVLAVFAARQLHLVMSGVPLSLPKLLLMGAALLTHYTVFIVAAVPFLVAEALETIYHDAQYHGWSMHYQRRRFPGVSKVAWRWLGAALAYGLIVGTIETLGYEHETFYWIFAPLGMLTVFHYYIDGKIWRFGDNPELREVILGGKP